MSQPAGAELQGTEGLGGRVRAFRPAQLAFAVVVVVVVHLSLVSFIFQYSAGIELKAFTLRYVPSLFLLTFFFEAGTH